MLDGAKRWIGVGNKFSFQPSEVAKIGLIIFYAALLTKNKERLGEMGRGFFYPFIFLIPIVAVLYLVQNHLSATLLIVMIISIMMLMAGTKLRYFLTWGPIGAGIAGARNAYIE